MKNRTEFFLLQSSHKYLTLCHFGKT